jgi:hypothetical protein
MGSTLPTIPNVDRNDGERRIESDDNVRREDRIIKGERSVGRESSRNDTIG